VNILKVTIIVTFAVFASAVAVRDWWPVRVDGAMQEPLSTEKGPNPVLIERLDHAIQKRFLETTSFGIARVTGNEPIAIRSNHLPSFSPKDQEESDIIRGFLEGKWKVSLFLYGRRAEPRMKNGNPEDRFEIRYRVNEPVPMIPGMSAKGLPKPQKLIEQMKQAFIDFQTPSSPNYNSYEFESGDWSYVARPVRATSQSCLACHTDYVITEKLPGNQFKFRKRTIGDANGVLVYGFARDGK
jgi:hypothetical protein